MNFKEIFQKSIKRWFLNSDGEISFTKVGIAVGGAGATILTLPVTITPILATVGITLAVPVAVIAVGKLAVIAGSMLAGVGVKDTADKNADKIVAAKEDCK